MRSQHHPGGTTVFPLSYVPASLFLLWIGVAFLPKFVCAAAFPLLIPLNVTDRHSKMSKSRIRIHMLILIGILIRSKKP